MPDTADSKLDYLKRHMFSANRIIQTKDIKISFALGGNLN